MANEVFTFDELPDSSSSSLDEGIHVLTIENVESVIAKTTKTLMAQFTYTLDHNPKLKLNYDNCPLTSADGTVINFGANKLKKIIKAVNVTIDKFTIASLKPLLVGKSFQAKLTKNEKGYLVLDASDINSIQPVAVSDLPQSAPKQNEEVKLNLQTESVDLEEEDNW